jgi:serine/threonine protein kinase
MSFYLTSVQSVKRYRLIRVLGAGAFGNVHECQIVLPNGFPLPRKFAVKILRDSNDVENVGRFAREARLLRGLRHPNLIRAVEINLSHDPPYFIMELMKETLGHRLESMAAAGQVFRSKVALETVMFPLCKAVAHVHSRGIFHRDIKPANIYFDFRDNPVLGDFGICNERRLWAAKLTWCGLGTPWYTAPETLKTGVATPQSDIFSLGVVLYEMLAGGRPWGTWWNNHGLRPSVQHPRSCHPRVDDLLIKMTHPDPNFRYCNVALVMRDILQLTKVHLPPLPAYRPTPTIALRPTLLSYQPGMPFLPLGGVPPWLAQ